MILELKRATNINCCLSTAESEVIRNLANIIRHFENVCDDETNTNFLRFIMEYYDSSISKLLKELADNPRIFLENCCEWFGWDY